MVGIAAADMHRARHLRRHPVEAALDPLDPERQRVLFTTEAVAALGSRASNAAAFDENETVVEAKGKGAIPARRMLLATA